MRLGSSPEKQNVKLSCPSNCFVGFHLFCLKTCRKPNRHHSTSLGMTNKKNSELETRQTDCSCTLFLFQQPPNLSCILFKHSEQNTMSQILTLMIGKITTPFPSLRTLPLPFLKFYTICTIDSAKNQLYT